MSLVSTLIALVLFVCLVGIIALAITPIRCVGLLHPKE
jgi:hypothetical protein